MSRTVLTEATTTTTATPVEGAPGRFLIELINPGWGSSGYYAPDVLEAAASAGVFAAGTHMYLDHPTMSDQAERPERSVRDLAAVLAENASWDGNRLVAEATVFGPYREVLEQMRDVIGVSIRASAEVEQGEAEGRRGRIIRSLVESPATSADFVTHAGRGGRIVDVLESAPPAAVVRRAVGHGVAEATANDTREALQQVLRETYGGEQSWVWVRDFDDSTVWYEHETPDESGTYAEGYALDDTGAVTLSGDRTEVRARTEYVPVNPAGQTTTQESEEDTMPQIEEARLRQLEEDAGRVQTLESERDAANQRAETAESERDQARADLATRDRSDSVDQIFGDAQEAAGIEVNTYEAAGIRARAVTGDDGALNEAATRTAFDDAFAALAEASGRGRPRGLGGKPPQGGDGDAVSEADFDALDDNTFGTIKEA